MAQRLDRIGQQVGDYRLLRWLGGGGCGHVYLAEHMRDRSHVALKLLHTRLSRSEELKAFINEARTIRLQHAHIVPLLDFGISQEEIPYLVMEYATQGTLRGRHPHGSRVPLPLIVDYAQQVASALQYAHDLHLIHRDVKPENMLLRADGTVLLSDFGLVTAAHSLPTLNLRPGIGGTLPYMAPEQIQNQPQPASDQYSLAVIVYEWITGRPPFKGSPTEVATQHIMKPPASLIAQIPTLSRSVEHVVLKALAKDSKDRFPTVQHFTVALEQAVQAVPDISTYLLSLPLPLSVIPDEDSTSHIDNNEYDTSPPIIYNEYSTSPIADNALVLSPHTSPLLVSLSASTPTAGPQIDWRGTLTVPIFYGREEEQALLTQWVLQEHARVISVLGMGGIGKSALVTNITHQLLEHFDFVIFRSLHNAPSCESLLNDCLQLLSSIFPPAGTESDLVRPPSIEHHIYHLIERLRKVRVLLILDNLECLLEPGDINGHFRPGFEGYEQLLQRLAETSHQSCLILTSREQPASLRPLACKYSSVHSLRLAGLDLPASQQLLEEQDLVGTKEDMARLIEIYAGNPLALKIVAVTIVDLFGGEIDPFLASGMVIFGSIADLLNEQFVRLSPLEQSILYWLTIMREPVTLSELQALLLISQSHAHLFNAVDAAYRRSLIERGKRPGGFTLQPVMLEYLTQLLITEACREIQHQQLDKLIQYSLTGVSAKAHLQQMQEQLLIAPLLVELHTTYLQRTNVPEQAQSSIPATSLEEQLLSLLDELRELPYDAQGYAPANLLALLRMHRGDLSGLDLSQLSLRGSSQKL